MNTNEKEIIKTLNKMGIETRFITLYNGMIYVNNLKFSKFSRKKEDEFHNEYPEIRVIRSKLFQKICVKVSRTVKNQIKPRRTLYIPEDNSLENIVLYMVLEPYRRKYGIKIENQPTIDSINVSNKCLDDFTKQYVNQMMNGNKIGEIIEENTIYPLTHVPHQWMYDFIESTNIKFTTYKKYDDNKESDIINFLEKHIPNVQESIKQSVNYLEQKQYGREK